MTMHACRLGPRERAGHRETGPCVLARKKCLVAARRSDFHQEFVDSAAAARCDLHIYSGGPTERAGAVRPTEKGKEREQ